MKLSLAFILGILNYSESSTSYTIREAEHCCQSYYATEFPINAKNNEIYYLKKDYKTIQNSIQTEKYRIQINNVEITNLIDDNHHLQASNKNVQSSIEKKTAQLGKLTKYLDDYKNQYSTTREDISNLVSKIEQEKRRFERLNIETKRQANEIDELMRTNIDLKKNHIDRNQQVLDQLKKDYAELNISSKVTDATSNDDDLNSQVRYYETNIAQVQTEINSVITEKDNCVKHQQSLNSNRQQAKKDYGSCKENLDHTRQYEDVRAAQTFLNDECKKITDKLNEENSINMNLYYSIKDKLDLDAEDKFDFC